MAAVNANMFDASISGEDPRRGASAVMVLPLNLIAMIVSHVCSVPARYSLNVYLPTPPLPPSSRAGSSLIRFG